MRLILSVVVGCLLALSTAACTGEEPPAAAPITSATSTPANPDATPPTMPDVAQEFSPNGAATFVSHYVAVLDYASKTGDVEELRALSDPNCEGCNSYIDLYESTYEAGGWFKGSDWTKSDTALSFDRRDGGETRATTTITIKPGTFKASASEPVESAVSVNSVVTFGLQFRDDWAMTHIASGDFR